MFKKRPKPVTVFFYALVKYLILCTLLALSVSLTAPYSSGFNNWFYQSLNDEPLRLGDEQAKRQTITKQQVSTSYNYPTIYTLRLDAQSLQDCVLGNDDYSPQDLAVYLKLIDEAGFKSVALSSPLHWEVGSNDMGMLALKLAFSTKTNSWLGLRGQVSTLADFTPEGLSGSRIPIEQVEGDLDALPHANKAMPNPMLQEKSIPWAIDLIIGEQSMQSPASSGTKGYPLLTQWNGELYPTLPLAMAIQSLELKPSDIKIQLGKELILGKRRILIDDTSRPITQHLGKTQSIPLSRLIDGTSLENTQGKSLIIEHCPKESQAPAFRLESIAQSLSFLTAEPHSKTVTVTEIEQSKVLAYFNPLKHKTFLAIALSALLLYLLLLPILPRLFCYSLYLFVLPIALIASFEYLQHLNYWFDVGACLTLILALIIFTPIRWKNRPA